tara:strand:- start:175 stop:555 length:381 start_codon:yes stop_codon:yes gene_type:complete
MKILLTLLNIFSPSILIASPSTTHIKSCYDGDTCTTSKGEKIRLACIDSPELKGINANPIPAREARDYLNNLIANKQVSIRRITNDRYGRTVAELYKDEINIQKLLVDKNLAKIYKKFSYQCPWIN